MSSILDSDLFAPDERYQVETWRLKVLLQAGYPLRIAERLAASHDVDLHKAVELLDAGCPPKTAARILL